MGKQRWGLDQIPWHELQRDLIADSDDLFYMVATASFIEVTSDVYTGNLVRFFEGDEEVSHWLETGWEPEELQHGAALRAYVQRVWPDFDWFRHYAAFKEEYTQLCKPEMLMATRGLEMAARCVVEMGTSCYYTALRHASPEPVLAWIARNIYEDEVRHYKHFYRYFRRYREREGVGRTQVLGAIWHRLRTIDDEDTYVSLKHVHGWRTAGQPYNRAVYKDVIRRIRRIANGHFPHHLSAGMLLKPLDIPPPALRVAMPVVAGMSRLAML